MTDVARQGQQTAGEVLHLAGGRDEALAAVDVEHLHRVPEGHLAVRVDTPTAPVPIAAQTDIAAVKMILRTEAIYHGDRLIGERLGSGRQSLNVLLNVEAL